MEFLKSGILAIVFIALILGFDASADNLSSQDASRYALTGPETSNGQSATLLPDGTWLLLGGQINGQVTGTAKIYDPVSNKQVVLAKALNVPRAWHTATLLPTGQVLIFGGLDNDGRLIKQAELFDPGTRKFSLVPVTGLALRSHHTANVLTSGQVLFAGGAEFAPAQLWDPQTSQVTAVANQMLVPRMDASSTLLPTSPVLIWGGYDSLRQPVGSAELYLPQFDQFVAAEPGSDWLPSNTDTPSVAASNPDNNVTGVAVSVRIAVRFNERLDVKSLNAATVTLIGPDGTVPAAVVPVEQGMLLFVTPRQPLLPASYYTLFVNGARTPAGTPMPFTTLGFETAALSANQDLNGASANNTNAVGTISVSYSAAPLPGVWHPVQYAQASSWIMGPAHKTADANVPLLNAAAGVTALSGQVLLENGAPLAGVTVSLSNLTTVTDSAGRFLLQHIPAGQIEFIVNGRTANTRQVQYGQFVIGATVQPNITNKLGFTVWMPVIDTAHAVNIPSPTTQEMDVTSPLLPGVVLKIPAGVVIREPNGNIVTQVSLTPVPIDRSPVPMPTSTAVYFVIQPGGATLESVSGNSNTGAELIYPNVRNQAPGTPVAFWYYDPATAKWLVYAHGKISPDGARLQSNRAVNLPAFTPYYSGRPDYVPPPPPDNPPIDGCDCGDPVDPYTGVFMYSRVDMVLPDTIPIVIRRTYQSSDTQYREFGVAWSHDYATYLYDPNGPNDNNFSQLTLVLPTGSTVTYTRTSSSSQTGLTGLQMTASNTPSTFYGSSITYDGQRYLLLTLLNGTVYEFDNNNGRFLGGIENRVGQTITFGRSPPSNSSYVSGQPIDRVNSPNGRWVTFNYASTEDDPGYCCEITQVTDMDGNTVSYTYDSIDRLVTVTYPDGGVEQYTYNGTTDQIASIILPNQQTQVSNVYDNAGRVIQQTYADGGVETFQYTVNSLNQVTQTVVTDPNGNVEVLQFNSAGYVVSDTRAWGTPNSETTTYVRDPVSNLVTSMTDALDRTTQYNYDGNGNVTSMTRLEGTANAVTYIYTYTPTYNELATITDPLNHMTTFGYDSNGNLTSITDPLGHQIGTMAYNSMGLVTSVTDALSHSITFGYGGSGSNFSSDLTSITDALSRTTHRNYDILGRIVTITRPLGDQTGFVYDAMNRVLQISDALGAVTAMNYDHDGNLLSVTDAKNHATGYTYDAKDRLKTRTDALNQTETFSYDLDDNLTGHTDRKGQSQTLTYDALNRLVQVTYMKVDSTTESTVSYNYDAGNRMTGITDSTGGILTESYDGLDRIASETSPNGTVEYQYDTASRRTQMQVAGQNAVNYGYDNANRLTSVIQGGSIVSMSYDNTNRRTTLTLPNGIQLTYGYDNANELTGLTYKLGTTTVGNLTYGYDNDGRIINRGGTFDVTNLPASVTSTTYDANNRMTTWGSKTLSYDNNGNLLTDGTNIYTWNTRNQLVAAAGGTTESFVYDASGRRESKTIDGTATNFLYDGLNMEQELNGTTPTANYLTGGGIDEVFSRSTSGGTQSYLTDNLGSTLALTSSAGTIQTSYTYEPYGSTTQSGSASTNAVQYTGRENDGDGLYYNRARYYSPLYSRFVSEDPKGLVGGFDSYTYVRSNPIAFDDPLGLDLHVGLVQGADGFGHVEIGVDQGPMYGAFEQDKSASVPLGQWVPAEIAQDPNLPIADIVIPTTPDQDEMVEKYIKAILADPGKYQLYHNSCVDFVRDALMTIGIPSSDTIFPIPFFIDLAQRYDQQLHNPIYHP